MNKITNNVSEVLHRIKVRLYPNYLPGVSGACIARTNNEAALSIEDVCAAARNRGGFTGNYEDLVRNVKAFFDEAAYQLADGFAVNTGWFSLYPKIGGTFSKTGKSTDPGKYKVDFAFRPLGRLRELADKIAVEIEGLADVTGYIGEILDIRSGGVDGLLSPGGTLAIMGCKIKIAGAHPDVGVWFYQEASNAKPVKVTENLSENTANKVIATIPALKKGSAWRVRIITQFTNGTRMLKTPRTLEHSALLTVA
ncbi:MAG: DUF4469 domain-containing protein [Treponema sp.]|nr:DUF4469 domain-containing protein [Treponema sp.]